MSNDNTTVATPELTPELVRSKLQIALTKVELSVQGFNDAESKLVYNEDNLEPIKQFIENCKKAEKIVDDERKLLKEPFLQGGRAVDDGAKLLSTELATVKAKANVQFQKLCQEVEKKRQEAEKEALRKHTVRQAMNNFKTEYAVKIADAKTSGVLVGLERMINLETANKNRYQEFLEEFKTDCGAIRSLLAEQKEKVRELEELEEKRLKLSENNARGQNDEALMEIMDKKEGLATEIAEKAINIQEESVNQASKPTESATVILPIIPKGGRKTWSWELIDLKAATKAGLTLAVPNEDLIAAILVEKRKTETECTENGIRYFINKSY